MKEVADSNMLVSLHHSYSQSANFEVFNVTKNNTQKLFSSGEIKGSKLSHTTYFQILKVYLVTSLLFSYEILH